MGQALTPATKALIRELFASGSPRKIIAHELGLHYQTVRRYTSPRAEELERAKEARKYAKLRADPSAYAKKIKSVVAAQVRKRRKKKLDNSNLDYSKLPESLREQVCDWIERGRTPGSFLRSVIRNDLREAVTRASAEELVELPAILRWFYHEAPQGSHGADRCMSNWPMYIKAKARQSEGV